MIRGVVWARRFRQATAVISQSSTKTLVIYHRQTVWPIRKVPPRSAPAVKILDKRQ